MTPKALLARLNELEAEKLKLLAEHTKEIRLDDRYSIKVAVWSTGDRMHSTAQVYRGQSVPHLNDVPADHLGRFATVKKQLEEWMAGHREMPFD